MNEINLGTVKMPINAATKTFAILAKRGAGKTYTGAVMAEEFARNNIPFVVIDPIDVWWGLRLASNGRDKGLPVVVFGVQHEDIKLDRDMGRKIAQAVVRENVSCVINTFGLPKTAQRHLLAEFADELLNINNTPRHIFIEEAHEYLPQRVFGGLGTVFNAVSNLVVMGRNRGIGVTLINQRAATINKDVLTQLDTLLAFQNTSPQDRKALQEWVEYHSADGDFKKFMDSLPSLPKGEGWIWSPEFMGIFERIKIRKRETFHPDREKLGDKFEMPELSQLDIQEFVEKFQKENKSGKQGVKPSKQPSEILNESIEQMNVTQLRNEYESQLVQKDIEIRRLQTVIDAVTRAVGQEVGMGKTLSPSINTSNIDMWVEKLGRARAAGKILAFLGERAGARFTRSQICLAVGIGSKSGNTTDAFSTLKRNRLIVEQGREITLSPDL